MELYLYFTSFSKNSMGEIEWIAKISICIYNYNSYSSPGIRYTQSPQWFMFEEKNTLAWSGWMENFTALCMPCNYFLI